MALGQRARNEWRGNRLAPYNGAYYSLQRTHARINEFWIPLVICN
jgi:hypothetical protein